MGCEVCIGTSDYDQAEFYDSRQVRARKNHVCCECRKPILRGEEYEHITGKWDGEIATYKTCLLCTEIRGVFTCGKGFMFESLWDEMRDYAFPNLTTATECFRELGPAAKERVLEEWRKWKGLIGGQNE